MGFEIKLKLLNVPGYAYPYSLANGPVATSHATVASTWLGSRWPAGQSPMVAGVPGFPRGRA
jgi:hypothetical protein